MPQKSTGIFTDPFSLRHPFSLLRVRLLHDFRVYLAIWSLDPFVHRGPGGGQASVIEIETKYTELCMEKTTLESEQARLGRSVKMETIAKLCSKLLCFSVSLTRFACVNSCGTGCGVRKLTRGWLTYPRRLRRSDLSSETLGTLLFLWPEGTGIYTIRYSYYEWHFNQCNSQSFTRRRCTEHHTASEWCHDPFAFGVSLAVHKTQPVKSTLSEQQRPRGIACRDRSGRLRLGRCGCTSCSEGCKGKRAESCQGLGCPVATRRAASP